MESLPNLVNALFQGDTICVHLTIIKMNSLKEQIRRPIGRLFGIQYAASMSIQELRKACHNSMRIRTMNPERCQILWRWFVVVAHAATLTVVVDHGLLPSFDATVCVKEQEAKKLERRDNHHTGHLSPPMLRFAMLSVYKKTLDCLLLE